MRKICGNMTNAAIPDRQNDDGAGPQSKNWIT